MEINAVLTEGFEKWMQALGYAPSTVYNSAHYARDFFFYLKKQGIHDTSQISKPTLAGYYDHLQTRKNRRRGGGLSQPYIAAHFGALKCFGKYLQLTGRESFEIDITVTVGREDNDKMVLTRSEIGALYRACGNDTLGIRDRAMLGIYYGCGLRRSEGVNLDVKDILLKDKLVHVRKGKNYRERYVPMTGAVKEDLENYLEVGRQGLLSFKNKAETAFFLSYRGRRIEGNSLMARLQQLAGKTKINKTIGLHALRHSIATHLLQSGMGLEDISRFLGHSSLESTQIYTHLSAETQ